MSQFPLFRLGTLLARQLSAPIATRIKAVAVNHPWFRRHVCVRTGRAFNACQLRLRLWTLALRQPRRLPPISDHAALESGASILGEAIVFGVGGLIVIFEVNRQANKQEDKVLAEASQWLALLVSLEELQRELVLQQQDIDRLSAALRRLAPDRFPPTQQDSQPDSSDQPVQPAPPTSSSPPLPEPTAELDAGPAPAATSEPPPPPTSDCPPPLTPECPPPPTTEC
ncbi:optic atrophy 3 protein homolog [Spodoptera frugiperda]|uniref:Optic atrophy 3 protein homolog n=1 Tax=Spodoptera frugiperda TaxID=7108 RepID=A0A9R0DA51_SPOFR|nr:optic atrophy 3 protein homolog [Spodoptera frugiperda]